MLCLRLACLAVTRSEREERNGGGLEGGRPGPGSPAKEGTVWGLGGALKFIRINF